MSGSKNRIILGCMTFGPGARVPEVSDLRECLEYFKSQGYNELDTARVYCQFQQESQLAKAGYKDFDFKVATKWYPIQPGAHAPAVVKQRCQESLDALEVSKLDIFYLHGPDRSVPFVDTLQAVNELHQEGKFEVFAISNFTSFEVSEICAICKERGWVRPRIYQGMYNCLQRKVEDELLHACKRWGLDFVCYNPLAGGLLSGRYTTKEIPAEGRFSNTNETQGSAYRQRYFRDSYFEALRVLEPLSAAHSIPLASMALRWMVHHSNLNITGTNPWGGRDGIIIGVSSKKQLEDNLKILEEGPLPEEVVKGLDKAWEIAKADCPLYYHPVEITYGYNSWE